MTRLLEHLDPQPTDRVLDLGCGDGQFTNRFISSAGYVLGVDASPRMIEAAKRDFSGSNVEFRVLDCCYLEQDPSVSNETWDKV